MQHRISGSLGGTTSNNEDNIHVAYTRTTDSNDGDKYDGKGKAAAEMVEQDADMMEVDHMESDLDDDNVTEYSFKSEDYPHDSELEDFDDDDARSHISLSDDEPEVPSVIGPVNWEELTRDQRAEYERMFGSIHHQPLNGSWTLTENYHRHIDEQCLAYLSAYKPEEWVLPRQDTEFILNRLLDRVRMRKAHLKIYGPPVPNSNTSRSHTGPHRHSQVPLPPPGHPASGNQTLRSQPSAQPMGVPSGVKLGQPLSQPMAFAQSQHYQSGGLHAGLHSGQPLQGYPYPMPGQLPPQPIPPLRSNMGPPAKTPRKLKINVGDRGHREQALQAPLPLKAPTPPYPLRDRPDQRKTVGKAGRGKTRRQAEADEFPWNRDLDFIAAREASQSTDSWDISVYDKAMLDEMERTRVRNKPVVEVLEDEITAKQKVARKKKNPPAKTEATSEEEGEAEADAEPEDQNGARRTKGGRKKSRTAGEAGDPYHSGNFAFASPEDQQLASTMGMRTVDDLIDAGMNNKLSLDELFRIKICWSPGKKGNSQDLEQAKFSVKDTVNTRLMLEKTPILTHRAGECVIDFCPDLLWRDILLRILSEAGFSNKDIRDRFCLNGSFSDRATVAKRLSAALGKDTNPPRGKGKDAALNWCETNRDDFDNYQAFFGKRPPARRTAQGRKNSKLLHGKTDEMEDTSSPFGADDKGEGSKKTFKMALDGAADEEPSAAEESDGEDQEDAVSLQDSDDLDAMSD